MNSNTTGFQSRSKSWRRSWNNKLELQKELGEKPKFAYSYVFIFDALILNLCLIGSILFKAYTSENYDALRATPLFLLMSNILWIVVASFTDIYSGIDRSVPSLKIRDLFTSSLIYFGTVSILINYLFQDIFRFHFILDAMLAFLFLGTLCHYKFRSYYKAHSNLLLYAVSGGTLADMKYLDTALADAYGPNTFCVGRFADTKIGGFIQLGEFSDIASYIRTNPHSIDKLIYLASNLPDKEIQRIIQLCRSQFIEFELVPSEFHFFKKGVQVEQLSQLPIFRRKKEPLFLVKNRILKRTFDIFFSLIVILLVFPWLFLIIAILIKVESKGPVFFIQERTGYWNKPFKMLKFRTMRGNSESDLVQATKGDARITRVGAFLRKTSLDELPQFFNVLIGNMSLVGPRPHMLKHTEDYSKLIKTFMIRHEVNPGITGWAQVSGFRGQTDKLDKMANRVEYDVNYIEGWNIWFDFKCILLTVISMLKRDKNAF